jgi:1-deoxy-D-xylulose-5-phosphate reductoisomerase
LLKKLAILGSTGSIGKQALEVVKEFPERFQVTALAAGSNLELLIEQARVFKPKFVVIADPGLYPELKRQLSGVSPEPVFLTGLAGLMEIASLPEVDIVLVAVVGSVGIKPTLAGIRAGKRIALANKETLVAAGSIIMPASREAGVEIIPVDSEHSAIFQCIAGRSRDQISKLLITASGGPFRNYRREELESVTLEQALQHPNWRMGGKITIDSATMVNKGLEIIEAHWLFNMPFDRIEAVVHPESVVHSMIQLADGSWIAQLGLCDMRLPIQLALTFPERLPNSFPVLDFSKNIRLNFEPVNPELLPAITLAYEAGRTGGSLPAALNAANEIAVNAFLEGKIRFTDILRMVSKVMGYHQQEGFKPAPTLDEILTVDLWAREVTRKLIENI